MHCARELPLHYARMIMLMLLMSTHACRQVLVVIRTGRIRTKYGLVCLSACFATASLIHALNAREALAKIRHNFREEGFADA